MHKSKQNKLDIEDKKFIRKAIALSRKGMNSNAGGPFGAVIVKDGKIIGEGYNQVTSTNDPTAHAEIVAIRAATKNLQDFQLEDCTIYASCEPCPMCLGAIYWARPSRIVYACSKKDAAAIDFDDAFIYKEIALEHAARSIKTEQLLREDGKLVFEEWKNKNDRIDY